MAAGLINIVLLIYLIKNKKKSVVIKQVILGVIQGLLYLPWLIYFASQLSTMHSNGFWIQLNFNSLIEILGYTFSGNMDNKIGMGIAIPVYTYLIYLMVRKRKEAKPAIFAVLIYVLIIIAALIMSKILGTTILYFRYMFVVTGLMFFAIAFMYTKPEHPYLLCVFIGATLVVTVTSNIMMIKENYDKSNSEPIEYLKSNLQEGDVILYPSIGNGSVLAVNFPEYKQYFFNVGNWGVEEAYKAFGPGMDTYVTTDFLSDPECQGRIWVVTSGEFPNFFDETFNNDNYKLISHEAFYTKYRGIEYQIHLVEKINEEE